MEKQNRHRRVAIKIIKKYLDLLRRCVKKWKKLSKKHWRNLIDYLKYK